MACQQMLSSLHFGEVGCEIFVACLAYLVCKGEHISFFLQSLWEWIWIKTQEFQSLEPEDLSIQKLADLFLQERFYLCPGMVRESLSSHHTCLQTQVLGCYITHE